MKVTLKQIQQSVNALNALLMVPRMPVKASYAVSKMADACSAEMQHYEKARAKVFTDAGCTIVEGQYVHDDPEVIKKCGEQVVELLDMEVELNALPLDLNQFGNAEVPGNAFTGLQWAMKQEE